MHFGTQTHSQAHRRPQKGRPASLGRRLLLLRHLQQDPPPPCPLHHPRQENHASPGSAYSRPGGLSLPHQGLQRQNNAHGPGSFRSSKRFSQTPPGHFSSGSESVFRYRTRPPLSHALGHRDLLSRFQAHPPCHLLALPHADILSPGTPRAHDCSLPDPHRHARNQSLGQPLRRPDQLCTSPHRDTLVLKALALHCGGLPLAFRLGSIFALLCTSPRPVQARSPVPPRPPTISKKEPRFGAAPPGT